MADLVLAPNRATMQAWHVATAPSTIPKYKGRGMRVIEDNMHDLAAFYDSSSDEWRARVAECWHRGSVKSEYVPRGFSNMADARDYCRDYVLPAKLKADAQSLSRELVRELVHQGGTPRQVRRLAAGHFDSGSMGRVVRDLHAGRFSPEATRPFKARPRIAPSRPSVGICADGSWSTFWNSSDDYVPRLVSLMLGIAWACEAVDCPVFAAITRCNADTGGGSYGSYDMSATRVIEPGLAFRTSDAAALLHAELYRCGTFNTPCNNVFNAAVKHDVTLEEAARLRGDNVGNERASSGGRGVAYMQSKGASITIAVGDISDKSKATLAISTNTDLDTAVRQLAAVLAEQNRNGAMAAAA